MFRRGLFQFREYAAVTCILRKRWKGESLIQLSNRLRISSELQLIPQVTLQFFHSWLSDARRGLSDDSAAFQ